MKSKSVLIKEEREKLLNNFTKLDNLGYTQKQVGTILGEFQQVISNIRSNSDYPISVKKASAFNTKIEEFLEKLNISN